MWSQQDPAQLGRVQAWPAMPFSQTRSGSKHRTMEGSHFPEVVRSFGSRHGQMDQGVQSAREESLSNTGEVVDERKLNDSATYPVANGVDGSWKESDVQSHEVVQRSILNAMESEEHRQAPGH